LVTELLSGRIETGNPHGFLWVSYGFLWVSYDFLWVSEGLTHGSQAFSMGVFKPPSPRHKTMMVTSSEAKNRGKNRELDHQET